MKTNPFSFFLNQVETHLPESLRPFSSEVKTFSRKMLEERLADLDLVPRAEYDQQVQLLAKAEQRLRELETRLEALESIDPS